MTEYDGFHGKGMESLSLLKAIPYYIFFEIRFTRGVRFQVLLLLDG